jgi:hypothetical protein
MEVRIEGGLRKGRTLPLIVGLASILVFVVCRPTGAAEPMCFAPKKEMGDRSTMFVDPKSKVCRAFQLELNANCSADIPTAEFKPVLKGSGLSLPAWEKISLFESGRENLKAFALLERLIRERAFTANPTDPEGRAKRDIDFIVGRVRESQAAGGSPRFEKVLLDLEGRGYGELLFRLYSGSTHNSKSINDEYSSRKLEPELFLARAGDFSSSGSGSTPSPSAAGAQLTSKRADVLLFDGTPYLLTWAPNNEVLIYAAYLNRNRPKIPNEISEGRTSIVPLLRCMFDSRPAH